LNTFLATDSVGFKIHRIPRAFFRTCILFKPFIMTNRNLLSEFIEQSLYIHRQSSAINRNIGVGHGPADMLLFSYIAHS